MSSHCRKDNRSMRFEAPCRRPIKSECNKAVGNGRMGSCPTDATREAAPGVPLVCKPLCRRPSVCDGNHGGTLTRPLYSSTLRILSRSPLPSRPSFENPSDQSVRPVPNPEARLTRRPIVPCSPPLPLAIRLRISARNSLRLSLTYRPNDSRVPLRRIKVQTG